MVYFRYSMLGKEVYYEVYKINEVKKTVRFLHNSGFFCHAVKAFQKGKTNESTKK